MSKCKCEHDGSMHSDQEYLHTGECFMETGIDDSGESIWCDCKEFVPVLTDVTEDKDENTRN